jgi:hypothetical protein
MPCRDLFAVVSPSLEANTLLPWPIRAFIIGDCGRDVCDGGHRLDVMNKCEVLKLKITGSSCVKRRRMVGGPLLKNREVAQPQFVSVNVPGLTGVTPPAKWGPSGDSSR